MFASLTRRGTLYSLRSYSRAYNFLTKVVYESTAYAVFKRGGVIGGLSGEQASERSERRLRTRNRIDGCGRARAPRRGERMAEVFW